MVKNPTATARDMGSIRDVGSIPESGGSPGAGNGNLLQYLCLKTPVITASKTSEFQKHIGIIYPEAIFGEGNGTPLQYSCLENPMDGGAW